MNNKNNIERKFISYESPYGGQSLKVVEGKATSSVSQNYNKNVINTNQQGSNNKIYLNTAIVFLLVLTIIPLVLAVDSYKPYLHSPVVPENPGVSVQGSFEAVLPYGSGTYQYPIEVPRGTNGLFIIRTDGSYFSNLYVNNTVEGIYMAESNFNFIESSSSDNNAQWVPKGHGSTWSSYQKDVMRFVEDNPGSTSEQITDFARELTREMYG